MGEFSSGGAFDSVTDELFAEVAAGRGAQAQQAEHDMTAHGRDSMDQAHNSWAADRAEDTGTTERYTNARDGSPIGDVGQTLQFRGELDDEAAQEAAASAVEVDWESETVGVQRPTGEVEYFSLDDAPPELDEQINALAEDEGFGQLEQAQDIMAAIEESGLEVHEWFEAVAEESPETAAMLWEDFQQGARISQAATQELQTEERAARASEILMQRYDDLAENVSPAAAELFKEIVSSEHIGSLADVEDAVERAAVGAANPSAIIAEDWVNQQAEDRAYEQDLATFGLPATPEVAQVVLQFGGDIEAAAQAIRSAQG